MGAWVGTPNGSYGFYYIIKDVKEQVYGIIHKGFRPTLGLCSAYPMQCLFLNLPAVLRLSYILASSYYCLTTVLALSWLGYQPWVTKDSTCQRGQKL